LALQKRKRPRPRWLLPLAGVALILAGAGIAYQGIHREPPAVTHYKAGLLLAQEGKGAEARQEWMNAIHSDPKFAPAYRSLSELEAQQGQMLSAAETLASLQKADPQARHILCRQAEYLGMANRYETALDLAREAVRREPDCSDAHNALGMLLEKADDLKGAAAELQQAHQLAPNDEALALDYARVLTKAGHPDDALVIANKIATEPKPLFPVQTYYIMGWILGEYGRYGQHDLGTALSYLDRALHINPDHTASNEAMGQIYTQMGQDPVAISYLLHACRVGPVSLEGLRCLQGAYERQHDPTAEQARKAADILEKAQIPLYKRRNRFLTHPDDADNTVALAALESSVGNVDDAYLLVRQVLAQNPHHAGAQALLQKWTTGNQQH